MTVAVSLPNYASAKELKRSMVTNAQSATLISLSNNCKAVITNRENNSSEPVYLFSKDGISYGIIAKRVDSNVSLVFVRKTGEELPEEMLKTQRLLVPQEVQLISQSNRADINTLKLVVQKMITDSEPILFPSTDESKPMATLPGGNRTESADGLHQSRTGQRVTQPDPTHAQADGGKGFRVADHQGDPLPILDQDPGLTGLLDTVQ